MPGSWPPEARAHLEAATSQILNAGFDTLRLSLRVAPPGDPEPKDLTLKELGPDASRDELEHRMQSLTEEIERLQLHLGRKQLPLSEEEPEVFEEEEYHEPDSVTRELIKRYTVEAPVQLPFGMLADFELYPQWMPWCTGTDVLVYDDDRSPKEVEVSFGIRGPVFGSIGDTVKYDVSMVRPSEVQGTREPAQVLAVNNGCTYATRLVYDWRFWSAGDDKTHVELKLHFRARNEWHLVMWEKLRNHIIEGMASAFRDRLHLIKVAEAKKMAAAGLSQAEEESVGDPTDDTWWSDFNKQDRAAQASQKLTDILTGPFKRAEAVVVTESDGRTIRYANEDFTSLTGYESQEVIGKTINSLLQGEQTNKPVTSALGLAVRNTLPASARLVNYRKDGSEFLSFVTFEPVVDDERNTGIVFWAVLKDCASTSSAEMVEALKGPQGQRLLSQRGNLNKYW